MLMRSRFAHYLKVMARDKIGSFMEVADCPPWLNTWIHQYVRDPIPARSARRCARPRAAADAGVEVRAGGRQPSTTRPCAYLRPHYQFETLSASMRLVADIPKKG